MKEKKKEKKVKPLTQQEVAHYVPGPSPVDHAEHIQQVMGIGLAATYDLAAKEAVVAKITHKHNKLGDVEKLPIPVKKKKK